jgi:hypothetical integral membrane protein (TIGR02206 family)
MFTTEHLMTTGLVVLLTVGLVVAARRRPGSKGVGRAQASPSTADGGDVPRPDWTVAVCRGLALLIVGNEASWWVWLAFHGVYRADYALPLQLCDVACFVSAAALWTRRPLLVELTWFWGLAGTANGLITPDVPNHFPEFLYLEYFIAHGGIVMAAFLLVLGLRISPRPWSAVRVFGLTCGLLVFDGLVDLAINANYLYLRHPPAVHSPLDLLGTWPWYIAGAAAIALLSFLLLELPFSLGRRRDGRRRPNPT